MRRPAVRTRNFEKLEDYYDGLPPSPAFARRGYFLLGSIFHPTVTEDDGAIERTAEIIADPKKRLLIPSNHAVMVDPLHKAALVAKTPQLHPLMGTAFILAKPVLFHIPVMRGAIDKMGAVPIFRASSEKDKRYIDPEVDAQKANTELNQVYRRRLEKGGTLMGYVEASRTKDPEQRRQLSRVKKGLGHIAAAVDPDLDLHVLPMAIRYDGRHYLTPSVHLGYPFLVEADNPDEITATIQTHLQQAMNHLYDGDEPKPPVS